MVNVKKLFLIGLFLLILCLPVSAVLNVSVNGEYVLPCYQLYHGDIVTVGAGFAAYQGTGVPSTCEYGGTSGSYGLSYFDNPFNPNTNIPTYEWVGIRDGSVHYQFYPINITSNRPLTANVTFGLTEKGVYSNKISGALITLSNAQTNTTLSDGKALIKVFPNSSTYTYTITKSGYKTLTGSLGAYGETGGTLNLEMELGGDDYYITVSPAWIPSDGSQYLYGEIHKTGSGEHNLTDLKYIQWTWTKLINGHNDGSLIPYVETLNNANWVEYNKAINNKYYGYTSGGYTNDKGATLPNPVTLNPIGGTGSILSTLKAIDIYGNNYEFNVSNLIGDNTSTNNLHVRVQDGETGGLIPFSRLAYRNDAIGNWSNITLQYSEYDFTVSVGQHVTLVAGATGYQNLTRYITVGANDNQIMNLDKLGVNGNENKTTIRVYTYSEPSGIYPSIPLADAYVTITQINNSISYSDYTNDNGIFSFNNANVSTDYSIYAKKTGYQDTTQIINTLSANPYPVYLYLKNNNMISPTLTPTPYPTITPTPTLWNGNPDNGTAAVCGGNSTTLMGNFKNNVACMGVEDYESQKLFVAGVIICVCAFIMGRWAKGIGAMIGASAGFLLSIVAGLLPIWTLFGLIIIAGMIFSIKIFGSDK